MITRTFTIVVACGVLAGLAGCGSSGTASSTTQAQKQANAATSGQPVPRSRAGSSAAPAPTTSKSSAPTTSNSAKLTRAYGSLATFGHGASAGDRASVLAAFHAYLSAIAAGDWTAACEELSTPVKHQLQALLARADGGAGRCAPALGALLGRTPSSARRRLAQADVIAVRTDGDHAVVLYRSAALSHASIAMLREAGRWTAGVLSGALTG